MDEELIGTPEVGENEESGTMYLRWPCGDWDVVAQEVRPGGLWQAFVLPGEDDRGRRLTRLGEPCELSAAKGRARLAALVLRHTAAEDAEAPAL